MYKLKRIGENPAISLLPFPYLFLKCQSLLPAQGLDVGEAHLFGHLKDVGSFCSHFVDLGYFGIGFGWAFAKRG